MICYRCNGKGTLPKIDWCPVCRGRGTTGRGRSHRPCYACGGKGSVDAGRQACPRCAGTGELRRRAAG